MAHGKGSSMASFKILVVGGSGFIGTRLTRRLLQAGHSVRIFDRVRSSAFPHKWISGDVRDSKALLDAAKGFHVIYHLAAEHRDDVRPVSLYDDVNIGGTKHVCAVADTVGINRIIFTSTVALYALDTTEIDENSKIEPMNDYGRTKLAAEGILQKWVRQLTGRSLTIIRPTVVFGEANRGNVYNLIRQVAKRRFVMVGSGRNLKSMAYVENVAAFLEFALAFGPGEHIFNYVDKPDLDMKSLVRKIRVTLGYTPEPCIRIPYPFAYLLGRICDVAALITKKPLAVSSLRVRKFCTDTCFSSKKAMLTEFQPKVSLVTALEQTVRSEFGDSIHN